MGDFPAVSCVSIAIIVKGRGTPANIHESAMVPGLALALKDYGVRLVFTREEKGARSQYGLEWRPTRGDEPHALTDDLVRLEISVIRSAKGARRLCLKTRGDMSIHIQEDSNISCTPWLAL